MMLLRSGGSGGVMDLLMGIYEGTLVLLTMLCIRVILSAGL